MRNLRDVLGINVHTGQHLDLALALGFRHFRCDLLWSTCNPAPGVWQYEWTDPMMDRLQEAGATVLPVMYATPAYLGEGRYPVIPGWNPPPAIPIMQEEWVPFWLEHCAYVRIRWPWLDTFNIATETTLARTWGNPDDTSRPGGPERYVSLVLEPVSGVFRPQGIRIVSPGQTMRGESEAAWRDAMAESMYFVDNAEPLIDTLDVHIYRESGADTVGDFRRFLGRSRWLPHPVTRKYRWVGDEGYYRHIWEDNPPSLWWNHWRIWCSETGFSGSDEAEQEHEYKVLLDALETDPFLEAYERVYLYSLWGNPASILDLDGRLRPAAFEIQRRLSL